MPCDSMRDWTPGEQAYNDVRAMKKELDDVTRMLCTLLQAVDGIVMNLPPDIKEWKEKHEAYDRSKGRRMIEQAAKEKQ